VVDTGLGALNGDTVLRAALALKQQGATAEVAGQQLTAEFHAKYPDWGSVTGIPNAVRRVYEEAKRATTLASFAGVRVFLPGYISPARLHPPCVIPRSSPPARLRQGALR
jgi:hypothetical protein